MKFYPLWREEAGASYFKFAEIQNNSNIQAKKAFISSMPSEQRIFILDNELPCWTVLKEI